MRCVHLGATAACPTGRGLVTARTGTRCEYFLETLLAERVERYVLYLNFGGMTKRQERNNGRPMAISPRELFEFWAPRKCSCSVPMPTTPATLSHSAQTTCTRHPTRSPICPRTFLSSLMPLSTFLQASWLGSSVGWRACGALFAGRGAANSPVVQTARPSLSDRLLQQLFPPFSFLSPGASLRSGYSYRVTLDSSGGCAGRVRSSQLLPSSLARRDKDATSAHYLPFPGCALLT